MRRFEFAVDREHARAVNEVLAAIRRLRILAIVAALILGVGTAGLVWLQHPYSFLLAVAFALGTITALFVAVWTPYRSRIEKLYAEGDLVPAVVSSSHAKGVTLLALVDLAKPGGAPRYALVTRVVHGLPGHRGQPGERVPAVTVRADLAPRSFGDLRQPVSAMPIAWGTRDFGVIERAREAIREVEWQLLVDNLDLAEKAQHADSQRLLLDPRQLPDELH